MHHKSWRAREAAGRDGFYVDLTLLLLQGTYLKPAVHQPQRSHIYVVIIYSVSTKLRLTFKQLSLQNYIQYSTLMRFTQDETAL